MAGRKVMPARKYPSGPDDSGVLPFSCSTNVSNDVLEHLRRAKLGSAAMEFCLYMHRRTFAGSASHLTCNRRSASASSALTTVPSGNSHVMFGGRLTGFLGTGASKTRVSTIRAIMLSTHAPTGTTISGMAASRSNTARSLHRLVGRARFLVRPLCVMELHQQPHVIAWHGVQHVVRERPAVLRAGVLDPFPGELAPPTERAQSRVRALLCRLSVHAGHNCRHHRPATGARGHVGGPFHSASRLSAHITAPSGARYSTCQVGCTIQRVPL